MTKLLEMTVLEQIVEYQVRNRQVGHTTAMLEGVGSTAQAPLIVVGNSHQAHWIAQEISRRFAIERTRAKEMVITVHAIKRGALNDIKGRPLVIDNIGLWELALDVSEQRRKLLIEKFNQAEQEGMKNRES